MLALIDLVKLPTDYGLDKYLYSLGNILRSISFHGEEHICDSNFISSIAFLPILFSYKINTRTIKHYNFKGNK